jgi:hypothetical protein
MTPFFRRGVDKSANTADTVNMLQHDEKAVVP